MKKNYVFFDFDGTLVNSSEGIFYSIDKALKELKLPPLPISVKRKFIGPPLEVSFEKYLNMSESQALFATSVFRKYYKQKGTYLHSLYFGVEEMLNNLKSKGKTLAVATSKPEIFAKLILENYNLKNYFSVISGSNENGGDNAKKDVLKRAISLLNVKDLNDCVLVGDTVNDVFGAGEVGIDCIGVLYGFGNKDELQKNGAKMLAETPQEVVDLLD